MDRRETLVNVLLGVLLLAAAAAPVAGIALLLFAVSRIVERLFPAVVHYNGAVFVGFLGLFLLVGAVIDLRGRRWRVSFLNLALAGGFALICYQGVRSGHDCDVPFALVWIYALVLPRPSNSDIERRSFLLSAPLICLVLLLNTGVLGSGELFRAANLFLYACVGAWCIIWVRKVNSNTIPI